MRFYEFSTGFGLDQLQLRERESLTPGPGQVIVKVHACSLNYRDLLVAQGAYGRGIPAPRIPLSDGAGEVIAAGPGVTRVKPGDRVAGIFMQGWISGDVDDAKFATAMGGAIDGMLAEEVCLHEEGLVKIPEHLSYEEAAALPCAAVTAWNALFVSGQLQPGETVLVQGTGGVSIFALQFAKLAGARVFATSSSNAKIEHLKALGAGAVVNYKDVPAWDKVARDWTNGTGVDHVVEVGGAGTLGTSIKAIRRAGHIALIGVLTGGEIDPRPLLIKSVRLQGIYVGSRDMFEAMNRAISAARLRPVIDRVFPFEEARAAMEYMLSGAHFGKVIIRVS